MIVDATKTSHKNKPRIELPSILVKQKICDLFNNKQFIQSIDQIYKIAGSKAAELILLRAIDDCKYK